MSRVLFAFLSSAFLCAAAGATVIGTDSFDYPDGTIDGLSGGTGWTWHNASQTQTNSGGKSAWGVGAWGGAINWGNYALSGHALNTNNGGAIRAFGGNAWEAAFEAKGCVYYSVKYTPLEGQSWAGISGYDFDGERFFFGFTGGSFGIDTWPSDNPGYWLSGIPANLNQTYLLACAIDYDNDQLRLWIDPDGSDYDNGAANNTADVIGTYTGGNWNNQVRLASGNACTWDDLVVATTFSEVPEPATMCLLAAFGGMAAFARRRRLPA